MLSVAQDVAFVLETDKLKNIVRKTRNISNDRYENDAEHSWHICLMAMALRKYSNEPVEISRVVQMLIVHDLGEISSGDVIVYKKTQEESREELQAAKSLLSMIGAPQSEELVRLLEEFDARKTSEAKFANAMDRMEPVLQNINRQGETWKRNGIT